MKTPKLPPRVEYIIDTLARHGFRADVVGGAVRSFLLGLSVEDYDLTTDAKPSEVIAVFSGKRVIDTGIKHGTVALVLDGTVYEITTYRLDGDYKDFRHPDSVSFTGRLEEDLARRDFTVNAMCYSPAYGLTDLYGGREDLKKGLIRAVGDPRVRFEEDALRIMRALRFASVLGFCLEKHTKKALLEKRELLLSVSKERIYTEIKKLFSGVGAFEVVNDYSEVLSTVLTGLPRMELPKKDAFLSLEGNARLLTLYALNAKRPAADFRRAMEELKTDKKTRDEGALALEIYEERSLGEGLDVGAVCELLYRYGEEAVRLYSSLASGLGCSKVRTILEKIISDGAPYKISHLSVDGGALLSLGLKGPEVGLALEELLLAVIHGKCPRGKESETEFARGLVKRHL